MKGNLYSLQKFDSTALDAASPDFVNATDVDGALDDHGNDPENHDTGLQGVRPYHGLYASLFDCMVI